jgi:hypothetical protein
MSLMQRSSSRNGDRLAVIFTLLFPPALTLVYFTLLAEASVATQYLAYSSAAGEDSSPLQDSGAKTRTIGRSNHVASGEEY